MDQSEWLAGQFETHRSHLRAVAYRMLGSVSEADDAVQESWFRLSRSDTSDVANLGGWLTRVVARICLDMLRTRKSRRELPMETYGSDQVSDAEQRNYPEAEVLMADSVGLALLVVLDNLNPAERVAFVLHDIFDVPFEEVAPIVGRTPTATRQLASRARRRVHGSPAAPAADLSRQRELVKAFIAASRAGDFSTLLSMLDPEVVLRLDAAAVRTGVPIEVHGLRKVAKQISGRARFAVPALVNGAVGALIAPVGKLFGVVRVTFKDGKIVGMDLVTDPEQLRQMDLATI